MRDIPIIFSAPMVRALLEGRKTMTRRLAKRERRRHIETAAQNYIEVMRVPSPWQRVQPGDRLWVRETWCDPEDDRTAVYRADLNDRELESEAEVMRMTHKHRGPAFRPWRPPIHMPRWASRLTLVVTATKIERLQKIDNADAIAEGCGVNFDHEHPQRTRETFPAQRFRDLWARLHGMESWDANPEVVAIAFTVHKTNIDAMTKIASGA